MQKIFRGGPLDRTPSTKKVLHAAKAALISFGVILASVAMPQPAAAYHANDCSDVLSGLSSFVTNGVNNNKNFYIQVMNETGVPWEMLAAIHYRETNFSHTNPSNGQGIFQFVNGAGGPYPAGPVSDGEFVRQLRFMADRVQNDYVWRGSAPRERRKLVANEQNIAIVKDTLFSYNGRASAYVNQASHFGYNPSLQPYEGSPYVMNRFDCPRARMGIITHDYATGIDSTDTRYGAFTVFARLRGDGYWKSLWNAPFAGLGDSFIVAKSDDPNDLRQWVIYGSIKQYVPSPEVAIAWGLQNRTLATLNDEALSSFANGPSLDIVMRINGGSPVYLVDAGHRYWVRSQEMFDAFKLGGRVVSSVSRGLADSLADGILNNSVQKEGSPALYMVDGVNGSGNVVLHQYPWPDIYNAWEGENAPFTTLSASFFDTIDNAIGPMLSSTKIAYNNNEYQVVSGQKLFQSVGIAPLYPGVAQSVGSYTFNRLITSSDASRFIRVNGSPTVYLVDQGQKHPVAYPNLIRAWGVGANPEVNIVTSGYANMLSTGTSLTTYLGQSSGGQLYIMDGRKIPVPANLDSAYRAGTPYTASDSLLALQPTADDAKPLLKAFDSPNIYAMENSDRRYISSATDFGLWSGESYSFTPASNYIVDAFPNGYPISAYITDGSGNNYVVNGSSKLPVTTGAATNWGLSAPTTVASSTLSRLTTGTALSTDKAKVGNSYYLLNDGRAMGTVDPNIAALWQITNAPTLPDALVRKTQIGMLSRFARSSDASNLSIFAADNAQLYHIATPQIVLSLGYDGAMTVLSPSKISSMTSSTTLDSPIVKNSANQFYVIDNGTKRSFADTAAKNQWTNNGGLSSVTLTDNFLNLFGSGPSLSKSIKGSSPAVYSVVNGVKQWVLSAATYNSSYAPFTQTSDLLINSLPTGNDLP